MYGCRAIDILLRKPRQRVHPPRPSPKPRGGAVQRLGLEFSPRAEAISSTLTACAARRPRCRPLPQSPFITSYFYCMGSGDRRQSVPHRSSRHNQRRHHTALGATEMALALAGVPHKKSGVQGCHGLSRFAQRGPRARLSSVQFPYRIADQSLLLIRRPAAFDAICRAVTGRGRQSKA